MSAFEVAIVGGGVVGCAVAHTLTEAGVRRVVLFERASLAGGATGICPGGIRQQFEGDADCRLARSSVAYFATINDRLEPDSPFAFEQTGYLFLAESDEQLERFRANVALQNRLGIPSMLLSPPEIAREWPALVLGSTTGASFCPEDGFLEDCDGVTAWLARRARERGALVLFEDVRAVEREGSGWLLRTPSRSVSCAHVVLAAGWETATLASTVGLSLPIWPEARRLVFTSAERSRIVSPLVVALERGVAFKQLANGVFYLGWLRETPGDDDLTFIERTLDTGSTLLPVFAELPARRIVRGYYDTTPDRRPILGGVSGLPGLHLAAGFSGHGFMIAPAAAEIVVASITGRETTLPAADFSFDRFAQRGSAEGLFI